MAGFFNSHNGNGNVFPPIEGPSAPGTIAGEAMGEDELLPPDIIRLTDPTDDVVRRRPRSPVSIMGDLCGNKRQRR